MSEEEESEWGEQMEHALACYNLAIDGGDGKSDEEDPTHINNEETKGEREVQGPKFQILGVAQPLKTT